MGTPIVFIEAAAGRMAKTFTPGSKSSYPNAKALTSHQYDTELSIEGIRERFELIQKHAALGHAIHRGVFTKPLVKESRKGLTDKEALSQLLTIDIDGLDISGLGFVIPDQITGDVFRQVAAAVVTYLPPELQDVTYMAHASSSFGMKPGQISLHLDFMLAQGVNNQMLKLWLQHINFSSPIISDRLTLSNSRQALSWIIDPAMADNSRIVYIAPPSFEGVTNPFADDTDRWILVEKPRVAVDIRGLVSRMSPEGLQELVSNKVNALRKTEGLKAFKPKTKNIKDANGNVTTIITNPGKMMIELVSIEGEYARLNINGGDSGAYYVRLSSPEIVRNFKGETPFDFAAANEEVYNTFCERHRTELVTVQRVVPMIFRDINTDQHYSMMYDAKMDIIASDPQEGSSLKPLAKPNMADFMAEHGKPMPPAIPQRHLIFDPSTDEVVSTTTINQYCAPEHLRRPVPVFGNKEDRTYQPGEENAAIRRDLQLLCPISYKLMWHVLGADADSFNHFINWLSYVVQKRQVSNTAWILSGTFGTGKGLLQSLVLGPLIGQEYHRHITTDVLNDKFNSNMARTLLYTVDEFHIGSNKDQVQLMDRIKNYISEGQSDLRAMHREATTKKIYANWLFFSNHADVMRIEPGDRRFNVATPQQVGLLERYPEIPDELDQIKGEIAKLAGYLMAFETNTRAARVPMMNDAKRRMEVISLSIGEKFARAIRIGDLDFILENVCSPNKHLPAEDQIVFERARQAVDPWATAAMSGVTMEVEIADLQTVFRAVNPDQRFRSMESFRKMLETNQVTFTSRIKLGRRVTLAQVKWEVKESDILEMMEHGLLSKAGQAMGSISKAAWASDTPPEVSH